MASEQLIKEELQNSAVAPAAPQPGGFPHTDDESTGTVERAAQLGVMNGVKSEDDDHDEAHTREEGADDLGRENDEHGDDLLEEEEEEEQDDEAEDDGDDYESESAVDDDEDEGVEGDVRPLRTSKRSLRIKGEDEDDSDDGEEDEDEEEDGEEEDGDEEDEGAEEGAESADDDDDDRGADDDVVEDAEGVGAVKMLPGETDDESDSEASAAASESSDEEWEENAENAVEDDEDEDEEEETESNTCLFCKRDQEHAPSEDANFLTCSSCGETAHDVCAREYHDAAFDGGAWKCPDCRGENDKAALTGDGMDMDGEVQRPMNGSATGPGHSTRLTLKVNTPKASPTLRSATANAESVSEDHTDSGSRVLRKRRTSPTEADDSSMSLRKRRKNATDDLSIDGFGGMRGSGGPSSARSLRVKPVSSSMVSVVKKTRSSLILKMRVAGADLRRIFLKKRKYTKRGTASATEKKMKKRISRLDMAETGAGADNAVLPLMPSATSYSQPFYSFFDKETEEQKGKPYGGILTEAEADTSRTFPTPDDRRRFDEAKQKAEEEWRARLFAMQAESEKQPMKRSRKASGPASQIECIEFGGWEIDTWYAAPYPEEYSRNRVLYICEFCLKYMNSDYVAWRHKLKCPAKHPPGDEIYRHQSISVFEVDGRKNPVYCQNLCLLAKLFLGSKTLYYDVEPFLFYVLCEYDEFGYHFVGYFSKEKRASSQNNVSCILTLPIHQRKGYGNLLIDFSYLLTRVEKKTGSPEKPLSDMGLVSYRNYWRLEMCRYLVNSMAENPAGKVGLSIKKISDDTGMTADDVISALEGLRCLVRDPQTGLYAFRVDLAYCQEYIAKWESKKYVTLKPDALTWTPYVMGRGNATNFELGPALTAIAPREEDEEQKAAEQFVASLTNGDSGSAQLGLSNNDDAAGAASNAAEEAVETLDKGELDAAAIAIIQSTEPNEQDQSNIESKTADNGGDQVDGGADLGDAKLPTDEDAGAAVVSAEEAKIEANDDATHDTKSQEESATVDSRHHDTNGDDWAALYDKIPPTRFVVFPPVTTRRLNYPRGPIGRPPGSRTGSGTRGRSRYGTGHVRRSITSSTRPKATSSGRKKTGGTGRGPGRWPKGTKKSDYGNADSGPGLPPAWLAARIAAAEARRNGSGPAGVAEAAAAAEEAEEEAEEDAAAESKREDAEEDEDEDEDEDALEDTVQVHTPVSKVVEKWNGLNGTDLESGMRGRSSPRLGKNRGVAATLQDGEDTVMVDVEAEDA